MEVMIYFQVISIVCALRSWQLLPASLTAVAQIPLIRRSNRTPNISAAVLTTVFQFHTHLSRHRV